MMGGNKMDTREQYKKYRKETAAIRQEAKEQEVMPIVDRETGKVIFIYEGD